MDADDFHTSTHGIHPHLQLIWPRQKTFDGVKVENPSQQVEVHFHRVHYLNWGQNNKTSEIFNED